MYSEMFLGKPSGVVTRREIEPLVTLVPIDSTLSHDAEYEVLRNSDSTIVGTVHRRHWAPNVNYPGSRIRRVFKGRAMWFCKLPPHQSALGPRFHRMACETRWRAVEQLLRYHHRVQES